MILFNSVTQIGVFVLSPIFEKKIFGKISRHICKYLDKHYVIRGCLIHFVKFQHHQASSRQIMGSLRKILHFNINLFFFIQSIYQLSRSRSY